MNEDEFQVFDGDADGSLHKALLSYSDLLHSDLSKSRFAEEREWYECALFYQRRQWLNWDNSNKRWSQVKQDADKPRPMPVTNHFAKNINDNANRLGSGGVRIAALPLDDSDKSRRAAEFAEKAVRAIDKESGMRLLNPLLAKHVVLWGIGVTKDIWDTSKSNGTSKVPQISVQSVQMTGCLACGMTRESGADAVSNAAELPAGSNIPGEPLLEMAVLGAALVAADRVAEEGAAEPCPYCGEGQTVQYVQSQPVVKAIREFSRGRICTEVRPIFEIYFPRDTQNPNLSKRMQQRYRKPLSEIKRLYPEAAEELKADEQGEVSEIYLEALRSLVNYNYLHDQSSEGVTVTETWVDYDQLPGELQTELLAEVMRSQAVADLSDMREAGEVELAAAGMFEAPDGELDPVEQLEQWGIFIISAGGTVLDWGINPLEGKKPFTFYLWEVDPANVYPKGLGVDLIPLQKRLNRLDSLIELGMMSNAAGKWMWPTSQTTNPPTGSPADVIEYDPIGDGKIMPTFMQPSPFHSSAWTLRASVKQDFLEIGMSEGLSQPRGVTAFRGLAYLGAKAEEQISTQRFLWESAHTLRYEKCLLMARKYWDEARKIKVAGFNGKYAMHNLLGKDLEGEFILEVIADSSRPQTVAEKEQAFQMLLQGGMIDATDSATREFVVNLSNLDSINLADHLQYLKAERDLDATIAGMVPETNPYIKADIFLKVFSNFTLTEEFDALDSGAQLRVMATTEMLNAKAGSKTQSATQKLAQAWAPSGTHEMVLNSAPGVSGTNQRFHEAAMGEGGRLVRDMS